MRKLSCALLGEKAGERQLKGRKRVEEQKAQWLVRSERVIASKFKLKIGK